MSAPAAAEHRTITPGRSATRNTVRVLGLLAAFTGVEHGVGEISQGWAAPPAVVFRSWPHVAAFDPLGGEPAMSLVPNLLISGLLSVLVALLLGVWAVGYSDRPHTGAVMVGLSLVLLVVGGGFGPPLLGILTGVFATRLDAGPGRPPGSLARILARLWPWPLPVAVCAFLGLVPGTALLHAATGNVDPVLVTVLTVVALAFTGLAMASARAHDRVVARGRAHGGGQEGR